MKKITTLFKKNPLDLSRVIDEYNPENLWVVEESGVIATRKFDGMCCMIDAFGFLYRRLDVKKGKQAPFGAIPCCEADEITGHHPHWIRCDDNKKEDKFFIEAFNVLENKIPGTYELCGEKISTERFKPYFNRENVPGHQLIKHGSEILPITDFSYEGLREFLSSPIDIEGIVFYSSIEKDKMCKLRKKDFGIER